MPSPPPAAPVAFGLTMPLRAGIGRLARRPLPTLLPVLVLLLPLLPVALAVSGVLRAGADVALTELLAGAPRGASGTVIPRPDAFEVRLLVALAALLATGAALAAAAGLVAGATAPGASGPVDALGRAWRAWPQIAVVTVAAGLLVGLLAGAVVAAALLAGALRFQLTGVVLALGLGALAVVVVRLSLWPAVALEQGVALRTALRRSWSLTRGSAIRLVLAAVVVLLALALPTGVVWITVTAILDALADAELLELSPVAIGLWSLVLVPVALLVGLVVWGVGARAVLSAVAAPREGAPAARPLSSQGVRADARRSGRAG